MRDHSVFVIHYSQRRSRGVWHAEDDYEHKSWGDPVKFTSVYVASLQETAMAHWEHWKKYSETKDNPMEFERIEELRPVKLLLEIQS